MSNLIKAVYFNVDPSRVRTIDSDEKVEEYIPHIYDSPEEPDVGDFQPLSFDGAPHLSESDFEDGSSLLSAEEEGHEESELMSGQMQEKKEEILENARSEAEQIIAQAKEQAEAMLEQARNEGFAKGEEEGKVQAGVELESLKEKLQAEYERKAAQLDEEKKNLEPAFAELVVSLVRKLTGVVCEDKKEVILYLIGNAIRNLGKTSSIVLRVSKRDVALVSSKKNTLKTIAKDVSSFDVIEDESLTDNQCIIETDDKIIDCSLDSELQNLEEQIKLLAN